MAELQKWQCQNNVPQKHQKVKHVQQWKQLSSKARKYCLFSTKTRTEVIYITGGQSIMSILYLTGPSIYNVLSCFLKRMQVKGFSLSQGMTGPPLPPSQCPDTVSKVLKWWTWRRRLLGAGCLPCCSCGDQSRPGWPPPLSTSGSEPFYDPWKNDTEVKYHRRWILARRQSQSTVRA